MQAQSANGPDPAAGLRQVHQEAGLARVSALFIVLGCLCWPARVQACDCAVAGTCHAFWDSGAVFAGRVVAMEPGGGQRRGVTLHVLERFRGNIPAREAVITVQGSNCAYPFKIGESYLVFAAEIEAGVLDVSLCSRTQLLRNAGRDVAYARYARSVPASAHGRIMGSVELSDAWGEGQPLPPRTIVSATTAGGQTVTTEVNERGQFRFRSLPRGLHRLSASAPGGFGGDIEEVVVNDPRGCGETGLRLMWGGSVAGFVRDSAGSPVAGAPLQLVPRRNRVEADSDRFSQRARSRDDGSFLFEAVPPGEWRLDIDPSLTNGFLRTPPGSIGQPRSSAVDLTVLPNQAAARSLDVPLDLPIVSISGTLVDEDGKPLANAEITLATDAGAVGHPVRTGADGRFTLAGVAGHSYSAHAVHHWPDVGPTLKTRFDVIRLTAKAGMPSLRLIIK